MKDYPMAKKYVHAFLEIEPSNHQILVIDVSNYHHLRNGCILKVNFV